MEEVTGRIGRNTGSPWIEVSMLGIGQKKLYVNQIAKEIHSLSPNEIMKVLSDCETQIAELGPDNTPLQYLELLDELKKVIVDSDVRIEDPIVLTPDDEEFFDRIAVGSFGSESQQ